MPTSEKLLKLREQIPYKKIEQWPDPITNTKMDDLSAKDMARVCFALAYDLGRIANVNQILINDLMLLLCPIYDQNDFDPHQ